MWEDGLHTPALCVLTVAEEELRALLGDHHVKHQVDPLFSSRVPRGMEASSAVKEDVTIVDWTQRNGQARAPDCS